MTTPDEPRTRGALAELVVELLHDLRETRGQVQPLREAYFVAVSLIARRDQELQALRRAHEAAVTEFRTFRERLVGSERTAA